MLSERINLTLVNLNVAKLLLLLLLSASINIAQTERGWVKADFHIHTTMSDGDHTHTEMAEKAFLENNLDIISITDHSGSFLE